MDFHIFHIYVEKTCFSTHEITADPFFRRCHGAVPGGWAGSSLVVLKDMGWCEVETSQQMGSRWEFHWIPHGKHGCFMKVSFISSNISTSWQSMCQSMCHWFFGPMGGQISWDGTLQKKTEKRLWDQGKPVESIGTRPGKRTDVCYHLPWWSWFSISKQKHIKHWKPTTHDINDILG